MTKCKRLFFLRKNTWFTTLHVFDGLELYKIRWYNKIVLLLFSNYYYYYYFYYYCSFNADIVDIKYNMDKLLKINSKLIIHKYIVNQNDSQNCH